MFSRESATVPVATPAAIPVDGAVAGAAGRSRGGLSAGGPILALCCLLLILFVIAATIVLALIPVYLPSRSANVATRVFFVTINFPGAVGNDGRLTDASRANIARAIERARNFPPGSVVVRDAVVATTPNGGKRRRRGLGLKRSRRGQTPSGLQQIFATCELILGACSNCQLVAVTFTETITIFNDGQTFVIVATFTISLTVINIPPTLGSTTSTAATPAVTAVTPLVA